MSQSSIRVLPEEHAIGRRALEGLPGFRLVDDFMWSDEAECWILHCAVEADVAVGGPIPKETFWYIWVQDTYPWGILAFYPAREGGITQTFQHQNYNDSGSDDVPWRTGRLCVDTGMGTLGREAYDIEPYQPEARLVWHVQRVQMWLKLASRNELTEPGDPFELPYVPTDNKYIIAFSEGAETFSAWQGQARRFGIVQLDFLRDQSPIFVAAEFLTKKGKNAIRPEWGNKLHTPSSSRDAWIMLNKVPSLQPWQIPSTWGELRQTCKLQSIDLDELLRQAISGLRDGKSHILLVGFPIPDRVGSKDVQVHWLALLLPPLTSMPMPGFRSTEDGLWRADRRKLFHDTVRLDWVKTENWHHNEITGRGRVDSAISSRSFLIIGAGAVGSALAELLVRSGVRQLTVMDDDCFAVGNLVRHTLTMDEIGKSKATMVAGRLNGAAIHSSVTPINERFPPRDPDHIERVLDCDVVIDCTADDAVAEHLSRQEWDSSVTFLSVSLGLRARRLFLFIAQAKSFPNEDFRDSLDPWLRSEMDGYDIELPRDGIGCWYPKLPARADDVWMMTSSAFKFIESSLLDPPVAPSLTVLEQQFEDGSFSGLRKADDSDLPC